MRVSECNAIIAELMRQKELEATELMRQKELEAIADQYNHWAFIAAMIGNGASAICGTLAGKQGKEFKPEDFVSKEALGKLQGIKNEAVPNEMASLIQEAKEKGLKGPW